MIRTQGLTKTYSPHSEQPTRIGPIDLEIPKGGITALVGPNGAGKSTLLTMIGRLTEPDSGTAEVAGHDVFETPSRQIAQLLSILRQENHFVTRLTVKQLVSFGRYPYSQGRLNTEDEKHIVQAIDFLSLSEFQDRYLDQLSGGQRQRAYVAMVLAQDTEYVLLDEPLNNLDMQHSVQMMKQLRIAADELHKTIVIVLHDINFAAHYADYICAMDGGNIVHFGTTGEMITEEVLTEIFHTPCTVTHTDQGPVVSYFS